MSHIYLVYQLIDPFTNQPYYVGFAKNHKRPSFHYKEYKAWINKRKLIKHPNYWKLSRIRDIIEAGGSYISQIVYESGDPDLAYNKEQELIKYYGRLDLGTGILTNMNDGGKGFINPGPSLRARISATQSRPLSEKLGPERAEQVKQTLREYAATPIAKEIAKTSGLKGAQHVINNGWSQEAITKRVATRLANNSYSSNMTACHTPDAIWKRTKKKLIKTVLKVMKHYRQPITQCLLTQAKKDRFSSLGFNVVQKYFDQQELDDLFKLI